MCKTVSIRADLSKAILIRLVIRFVLSVVAIFLFAILLPLKPAHAKWSNWIDLGGDLAAAPAVVSTGPNRLDVFVRGKHNDELVHRKWDGNRWSGWINLGGDLAAAPAVVSTGPNRLDVFVRGKHNDELVHRKWDGHRWSGWINLGGHLTSAPAVVATGPNKLYVFIRGLNGRLVCRKWDGNGWSGWINLGGDLTSAPAVVATDPNNLYVFIRGLNNRLVYGKLDGNTWSGWVNLGGHITSAPAATATRPNKLYVFVRGLNNELVYRKWDGNGWSGWVNLGGHLTSAPAVTSSEPERLDIFFRGKGNDLFHRYYPSSIPHGPVQIVYDGEASVVSEFLLDLNAGIGVTFGTINLSVGSDPVLHLLDSRSRTEVAVDDNSGGGKAARLNYTPGKTGKYRLVVRARTQSAAGTCDILWDGELWEQEVEFGGWHIPLRNLQPSEQIQTVRLPNGPRYHSLYLLDDYDISVKARRRSRFRINYSLKTDIGSRWVIIGIPQTFDPGPIRLLRNDVNISGHDPDDDGLGTELENALGTCSSLTGFVTGPDGVEFDCSKATDPRDTDGDGISDGWEVLGRDYVEETAPNVRKREHLPLPLWGADPRHKDIFLEVDFMQRSPGEADRTLGPHIACKFAAYYADELEDFPRRIRAFRAVSLGNPDRKPGIRLHIDGGKNPPDARPQDSTIYGDWGGHNPVPPIPDPENPGGFKGAKARDVWKEQMAHSRRGIFHYALAFAGGGSQTAEYRVYSSWVITSALNAAHEFGHSLGLGHSGRAQESDIDPNGKPNYPSIMNYAYHDHPDRAIVGFSDGRCGPALNNVALVEMNAVDPADTRYLDHLENVFQYNIDRTHGHVDWNRDGFFSPGTVRAYANFAPGGAGCEWTRYNYIEISETSIVSSPSLARLGNRTYLFYVDPADGKVNYTYSTSEFDCPEPEKVGCNGASFEPIKTLSLNSAQGVDAVRIRVDSESQILVVVIDSSGRLWETRLTIDAGVESWSTPMQIAGSPASGEPSLVPTELFMAYLAYKGTDGRIRTNLVYSASWAYEKLAMTLDDVDPGGSPVALPAMSSDASPALGFVYLPWQNVGGTRQLYGAFAGPDGKIDLWWFDMETELWQKTDVLDQRSQPIRSRPTMAWVPTKFHNEYPGRFYLMYATASGESRMMMSYASGIYDSRQKRVGLDSYFNNIYASALGMDLLFEPGIDTNLRAVIAHESRIRFRPKADGINDYDLVDVNDWEVFSVTTSRTLIYPEGGNNPDPLLENPIRCPEITWK